MSCEESRKGEKQRVGADEGGREKKKEKAEEVERLGGKVGAGRMERKRQTGG